MTWITSAYRIDLLDFVPKKKKNLSYYELTMFEAIRGHTCFTPSETNQSANIMPNQYHNAGIIQCELVCSCE